MAGVGAWVWAVLLLGLCRVSLSRGGGGGVGGLGLVGAYWGRWRAWLVGDGVVLVGGTICLYDSCVGEKSFGGW